MSSIWRKVNYEEEGYYGTVIKTLYCQDDDSTNIMKFFNEQMELILSYDKGSNDIGKSIVKLLTKTNIDELSLLSKEELYTIRNKLLIDDIVK